MGVDVDINDSNPNDKAASLLDKILSLDKPLAWAYVATIHFVTHSYQPCQRNASPLLVGDMAEQNTEPGRRVRVRGFTPLMVEILAATQRLLENKVWVSLKEIVAEVERTRKAARLKGKTPLTARHISRVFINLRNFYPEGPERVLITFREGVESRYQLNGASFVTRRATASILAEICNIAKNTSTGVARSKLMEWLQASGSCVGDDGEINDRLRWLASSKYITISKDGETVTPKDRAYQELGYCIAVSKPE